MCWRLALGMPLAIKGIALPLSRLSCRLPSPFKGLEGRAHVLAPIMLPMLYRARLVAMIL